MRVERENEKPRVGMARKAARNILTTAQIQEPPIMLREIVAHLKKSHKLFVSAWNLGDGVDGIQIKNGDEVSIAYNQLRPVHRQRFTVAHEIGHFVLGHTSTSHERSDDNKPEEIEANQFAAELLMPLKMLKRDINNGANVPKQLAKRYFVSEEAMWNRLKDHSLLNLLCIKSQELLS